MTVSVLAAPVSVPSVKAPVSVFTKRVSDVKSVGKGIRISETATAQIVASLPDGFDVKASGAVTGAIHAWATGCVCPSGRGKTCQCGKRESVKIASKATDYGRGVDALTASVRKALAGDAPKPIRLAATLSGEGIDGGTVEIPRDSDLGVAILALIAASNASA